MTIEQLNEESIAFANAIVQTVNAGISRGLPILAVVGILEQIKTDIIIQKMNHASQNQANQEQGRAEGSTKITTPNGEPRLVR